MLLFSKLTPLTNFDCKKHFPEDAFSPNIKSAVVRNIKFPTTRLCLFFQVGYYRCSERTNVDLKAFLADDSVI